MRSRTCRRHPTPEGLLLLDLDHFKRINNSCGHEAGDGVLVDLARLVTHSTRQGDRVCAQRRIEAKNSSFDLVVFILSSRNSIAPISSMPCSSLRRIQIFCSRSGSIR